MFSFEGCILLLCFGRPLWRPSNKEIVIFDQKKEKIKFQLYFFSSYIFGHQNPESGFGFIWNAGSGSGYGFTESGSTTLVCAKVFRWLESLEVGYRMFYFYIWCSIIMFRRCLSTDTYVSYELIKSPDLFDTHFRVWYCISSPLRLRGT